MGVKIAPDARRQFVNASGVPYSGAKLFYYAAGSTTKQNTYTTSTGVTPNSNPIILDSAGRTPYGVWFTEGLTYKEVLAPSTDTDPPSSPIFTEDNLAGVNDTTVTVSQWAASSLTPTYTGTTTFTVAGDQTSSLHVGRRLQFSVTAGTVYGRISASVYGAVTTVTMVMDSGQTLDSGLSSFNWSILTATNPAVPKLSSATWVDLGVSSSPIPTGTVMLFFQAAAPTGWTQVATQNNKALRVVSGTGAGTGGSVAFTTAFASQAVTGSNSATTLSKAQIPQHVHTYTKFTVGGTGTGSGGSAPQLTSPTDTTGDGSADGLSGGSHNHTFTGTAINLAVQYVDIIMASKD